MKKIWKNTAIFCTALLLCACSSQQNMMDESVKAEEGDHDTHSEHTTSVYDKSVTTRNMNDGLIIPSENGEKRQTTDEHGGTSHGQGTDVYSLIGSSGLNEGGISSHLESRLEGEGINGIKVFVIDDTIILARSTPEVTSNQYDSMQEHILNGVDGMSRKDLNKKDADSMENAIAAQDVDDNLEKAKSYMTKVFNGNVQTLTVTNPEAVVLIEKIKKDLKADSVPYDTVAQDIITLVKMTREK
jgi:predicted DNA binding CopG/RHH family protein